jgi:mono/diheme cytochrome c family protein
VIGNQVSFGEGGASATPEAGAPAGSISAGKAVFGSAGCGDCHALSAAGSDGGAGPDLDEAKPGAEQVRSAVTNGTGAMPSFEDELTARQISDVAAFVSESGRR